MSSERLVHILTWLNLSQPILMFSLLLAQPAFGQTRRNVLDHYLALRGEERAEDHFCRGTGHVGDAVIGKITGKAGDRAYYYRDDRGCPMADADGCKDNRYLIAGDTVVTMQRYGEFVCTAYKGKKGGTSFGWTKAASIQAVKTRAPIGASDWEGMWRDGDNWLEVKGAQDGRGLVLNGMAYWPAKGAANEHVGPIEDAPFSPKGDRWSDEECKLDAKLLPPYLIVKDASGSSCWGANVSYSGLYQR